MNAILPCLACVFVFGSQEDESTKLRVERREIETLKSTYLVLDYFRGKTRFLDVREHPDVGLATSEVFDVEGRKVYGVYFRRDQHFHKEKVDGVWLREVDIDSDGSDDVVAVEIDKDRIEYFRVIDPGNLEPIASELLSKAKERVAESPSTEVIDAICELIREETEDD